jgi:diguanylate cyclase (GGDEF)-like protein
MIEGVSRQIAHTFDRAIEFENSTRRDELTGLPSIAHLERVLSSRSSSDTPGFEKYALVFIDVIGLTHLNNAFGRSAGDEVLRHVTRQARAALRVGDILFRHSGDEFVAFLNDADRRTAELLAERIGSNITGQPISLGGTRVVVSAAVTAVCFPRDGHSLADLLTAARSNRSGHSRFERTQIH